MHFVSICLLTYRRAGLLPRSIDSLLAQTHTNFELIINDDNSPDNTEAVCREYERRDSRIRYFKNVKNLRYAGNQNAALARARSDYVAIVHDGDVYRPDLIEKWTRALVHHPSAALVFNALGSLNDVGDKVLYEHHHPYTTLVSGRRLFDEMLCRYDSPIFGIVMVRKSCVQAVGLFDTRFPVLGDIDMWFRLLLRFDAVYLDEALIQVAAREANHLNRGINWNIIAENEMIHMTNANRLAEVDAAAAAALRPQIHRLFRRVRLRCLLLCFKPGRWSLIPDGLRALLKQCSH